ncbi:TetR/AcrR family transcriptional regulator [Kibdelosporangium philippinense]|uniref:TetR/AcrR family transcriptional regulator n=1 Tax=Kibdelosporangium philippinense TaxID=211113 RepID=A0ABS8Z9T2_9PSEU|nr:TetR/AcrR family transcriptional regulator [Kibdelosporangium philippinense]MCE7003550.1 TetR/AcrR family transcriptional regulator [Kibdelosporangium philippinense]
MGHREQLLAGAKKCLLQKGYARTTARDIVAVSKTNLGSIGYHFGTKDALMNAALVQATDEWAEDIGQLLAGTAPTGTPLDVFEASWPRILELFERHRALWVTQFEVLTQLHHAPETRPYFSATQESARRALATLLRLLDPTADEKSVRSVGSFALAMLYGVIAQWLVDPKKAPQGADLAAAIRAIAVASGLSEQPGIPQLADPDVQVGAHVVNVELPERGEQGGGRVELPILPAQSDPHRGADRSTADSPAVTGQFHPAVGEDHGSYPGFRPDSHEIH